MAATDTAAPGGERKKWDDYYASLPAMRIDDAMRAFGQDLAARIAELLPSHGSVLEAGCGGGWQSLILAQTHNIRVALMDFSSEALEYARRAFAGENVAAEFVCQDVFVPGTPEFDLVFNAGVLEHYDFDRQVAFLRGMASRSRRYVLALVPNRECYWYWMWRMRRSARGEWPFGLEMPMNDLSAAFEAAGLCFLGHWHGGERWSEYFIQDLPGMDDRLRDELLAVHRSPAVSQAQRAYLVAGLGCKGAPPERLPSCWIAGESCSNFRARKNATVPFRATRDFDQDRLAASVADALAAYVGAEHRCRQAGAAAEQWQRRFEAEKRAHDIAAAELAAIKSTLWYRALRRASRLVRRRPKKKEKTSDSAEGSRSRLAAESRFAPAGSLRERCLRKTAQQARRFAGLFARREGPTLEQILAETEGRRGIVVYPPFLDWGWMRQRPHHLMAQFAKAGYLALYCSPRARSDRFRGFRRVGERLYLCDSPAVLRELPEPILLTSWTGHWKMLRKFRASFVLYDYLDDLGVSSPTGAADPRKVELHRKLTVRADAVLATSRRLFEEVRRLRPDAIYCPNAADYDHFHVADDAVPPPVPAELADVVAAGRPIIGYYGALARWLDYNLVARAAAARPDYEFILIGPDLDGRFAASDAARRPNVRRLAEKPYEALPAFLHAFSVATIPFRINNVTRATSPVKLFEYMAGGRPIVTTDLPECREHECVLIARNADEFIARLDEALALRQSKTYLAAMDCAARANRWESRAAQIIDRIEETAGRVQHAPKRVA